MVSQAYSKEQVREGFLEQLRFLAKYWSKVEGQSDLEKIEGAIFSVLNIIDGTGSPFISMDLVLRPHPDDKQYHIDNEEPYFENGMVINDDAYLHDLFYKKEA